MAELHIEINDPDDELQRELDDLNRELEDLKDELEAARANRSDLRGERERLRQQRHDIRTQIHAARAAGNKLEMEELEQELWNIRQRLEEMDAEIDAAEDAVDTVNDHAEDLQDQIEDLRDELHDRMDDAEENGGDTDFLSSLGQKLDDLAGRVRSAVSDIDWHAMGDQINQAVDSAFSGVYDAVKTVQATFQNKDASNAQLHRDGNFSGSITLDGGDWDSLRFSGSVKITADLRCKSMQASGSVKAAGDLHCAGDLVASGSVKADGALRARELRASGGVHVGGDVVVEEGIAASGSLEAGGSLSCRTLKASGSLNVAEDCTAESFSSSGKVTVAGLLNAEEIHMSLSPAWSSTVSSIGCGSLTTDMGQVVRFFSRVFGGGTTDGLVCDSIEGDRLTLVATTARTVRGVDVKIGPGCKIDRLEYSGSCEISPEAQVGKCIKTEC